MNKVINEDMREYEVDSIFIKITMVFLFILIVLTGVLLIKRLYWG